MDSRLKTLKALSDATRLAVVERLHEGPKLVEWLIAEIGTEATLMSHHLLVLKKAGIVVSKRQGKNVLYKLAPGVKIRGGVKAGGVRVVWK